MFNRRLQELPKELVVVGEGQERDLLVPRWVQATSYSHFWRCRLVVSACRYIEDQVEVEGLYRMSGSQGRQKVVILMMV